MTTCAARIFLRTTLLGRREAAHGIAVHARAVRPSRPKERRAVGACCYACTTIRSAHTGRRAVAGIAHGGTAHARVDLAWGAGTVLFRTANKLEPLSPPRMRWLSRSQP